MVAFSINIRHKRYTNPGYIDGIITIWYIISVTQAMQNTQMTRAFSGREVTYVFNNASLCILFRHHETNLANWVEKACCLVPVAAFTNMV